jgi:hypothetical protein
MTSPSGRTSTAIDGKANRPIAASLEETPSATRASFTHLLLRSFGNPADHEGPVGFAAPARTGCAIFVNCGTLPASDPISISVTT